MDVVAAKREAGVSAPDRWREGAAVMKRASRKKTTITNSLAVRGYSGYLAKNIRPAMSKIRAQLGELQLTLDSLEVWLSWHGLAGAGNVDARSSRAARVLIDGDEGAAVRSAKR
jgi:hypothetical protein